MHALRTRTPDAVALTRYAELATILTGSPAATIDDAIAWLRALVTACEIPPLASYGFRPAEAADVVAKARAASSMKANPLVLSDAELTAILLAAA